MTPTELRTRCQALALTHQELERALGGMKRKVTRGQHRDHEMDDPRDPQHERLGAEVRLP
jgi:hypothetical protein